MRSIESIHVEPILHPRDCVDAAAPSTFLQSKFWGLFKSRTGWNSYSCDLRLSDGARLELLVMRRHIGRFFNFLYVPFGLGELESSPDRWALLGDIGRALSGPLGGTDLFVRFDLPWITSDGSSASSHIENREDELKKHGIAKGVDVQVPDTVVLDLSKSEEDILAGMKPKWRYNIRLSEKKGIVVSEEGEGALSEFMRLYQATAHRDKIAIHPRSYYQQLFATASQIQAEASAGALPKAAIPRLSLYVARHEEEALASIIVLEAGDSATYMYGASSDSKRNLMPTYALQWHAILAAKRRGAISYDFFGIPPGAEDPAHPMAGLYLFKTGFGGDIVHRLGAYDVMLHPMLYHAFRSSESLRMLWHKKLKKGARRVLRNLFRADRSRA